MFFGIIATVSAPSGRAATPPRQAPAAPSVSRPRPSRECHPDRPSRHLLSCVHRSASPHLALTPGRAAPDADGDDQQDAGQHAGQLRRLIGEPQAVGQHPERDQSQHRAPDAAAPAENRRAAEDDGRDRRQLEAGPGVGPRLAQPGGVDQPGDAGGAARQQVDEREAPADRDAGEAGAFRRVADRAQRASDGRRVDEDRDHRDRGDEHPGLRRQARGRGPGRDGGTPAGKPE